MILLYATSLAIFLAIISIFYNWHSSRIPIFLSALLIVMSIHGITQILIFSGKPLGLLLVFYNNFCPIYFLAGPLVYFYIRGTLNDNPTLFKYDFLHFIPALIIAIDVAPYWFSSLDYKVSILKIITNNPINLEYLKVNWLIPPAYNFILRMSLLFSYSLWSLFILIHFQLKRDKKSIPNDQFSVTFRFLLVLTICMTILSLCYSIVSIQLALANKKITSVTRGYSIWLNTIGEFSFLTISISLIAFPKILYGMPAAKSFTNYSKSPMPSSGISINNKKELVDFIHQEELSETKLNFIDQEDPFASLASRLIFYIKENKCYLDTNFSIDTLANSLGVPRHHLNYTLNRLLKLKFPEFRQTLRVEHAKKLLLEGKGATMSIDGIGIQSGFSSRTTFFKLFKEEVGLTPTEFLQQSNM